VKRELSIYLDLVRFLAAMVVFLGHVSGARFTGGFLWQLDPLMDTAVVVFFVLSGYVIAFATDAKEGTPYRYFSSRAARIYSVAAPAIVVTAVLDPIGSRINPIMYTTAWGYDPAHSWSQALSLLTFTNEIWSHDIVFGSLLPYWSLGFEVWYYLLFGLALFFKGWKRIAFLVAATALSGPKIIVLFPLWLAGVLAYHFGKRDFINRSAGYAILFACAIEAIAAVLALRSGLVPSLLARRYLEGSVFVFSILGIQAIGADLSWLNAIRKPVRYFAGMTFSLYLIHLPVAQFLAATAKLPPSSWAARALIIGGTFAIVLLISHVTERRKDLWHRAIDCLCRRGAALPVASKA
jgi:peptidoglycan/LPS O-acetylase OafA/YrhL